MIRSVACGFAPVMLLLSLSACAHQPQHPEHRSRIQHVVVCWLKHHGDAQERQRLINASNDFHGKIPGLLRVRAGSVFPSTRPAVDSSFDVAIVMTFVDEGSLASYGKHPVHQQAVKDVLQPLVERYVIYDFTEDKQRIEPRSHEDTKRPSRF